MTDSNRWLKTVEKYGSEEAAKVEMARRAALSSRNKNGEAYLARLARENPELHKEISRKGGTRDKGPKPTDNN